MARPVWSGVISFGLVSVAVKAHPAVRDHDVHFHQIDKLRLAYPQPQGVGEDGQGGRERGHRDGVRNKHG
jgi:hypothetical protein